MRREAYRKGLNEWWDPQVRIFLRILFSALGPHLGSNKGKLETSTDFDVSSVRLAPFQLFCQVFFFAELCYVVVGFPLQLVGTIVSIDRRLSLRSGHKAYPP